MSTDFDHDFDDCEMPGADYDIGLDLEELDVPAIGRRPEPRVRPAEPDAIADQPDPPDHVEPDQGLDAPSDGPAADEPAEDDWLAVAAADLATPARRHKNPNVGVGPGWRDDADGFGRYRGKGRRGARCTADQDRADFAFAHKEFVAGMKLVTRSNELVGVSDPGLRRERRESLRTGLAKLAMATRMIDDIVERRGGITGDCL